MTVEFHYILSNKLNTRNDGNTTQVYNVFLKPNRI